MNEFIETYGYWALLVGTFFEGETIMILSGFAAHQGHLNVYLVAIIGFTGTFCGDQLWYFIGRQWGTRLVERFPTWKAPTERAYRLLNRYDALFILSFRFIYGVRNVSPVVIGMAGVPVLRYFMLNFLAAAIWAASFALVGYLFGAVVQEFFHKHKRFELWVFAAIAGVGFLVWVVHVVRRSLRARRKKREEEEA